MTRLRRHRRDWDDLASLDPYWSVLTERGKRFGGWDRDEFFRLGDAEIEGLMEAGRELRLSYAREAALDFGCGLGRLTRALARHFRLVCGVDISPRMVEQARELHRDVPNCSFQTIDGTLAFPSAHFDLIYSVLVLQHLPTRGAIGSTLRELVRTLRPGGLLCFQIPSRLPLRRRWQLRRRLYGVLRAAGVGERVLYERCGLHPIRMNAVAESEVQAIVAAAGGRMLAVCPDAHAAPEMASRLYFVTRVAVALEEAGTDRRARAAADGASPPVVSDAS